MHSAKEACVPGRLNLLAYGPNALHAEPAHIAKLPAPLACCWLGKTELDGLAGEYELLVINHLVVWIDP
jgi:hypothetical protein